MGGYVPNSAAAVSPPDYIHKLQATHSPEALTHKLSSPHVHSVTNSPANPHRHATPHNASRHYTPSSGRRGSVRGGGVCEDGSESDEDVRQVMHRRRAAVIESDSEEEADDERHRLAAMSPREEDSINKTMESLALQDEENSDDEVDDQRIRVEDSMS